jgi:ATP-dependent RNA helicase RhlE
LTELTFSELGLADPILRALKERAHLVPTPIQAKAIPVLLDADDLLGIAQTGTGKTAAFALPILDELSRTTPDGKRMHPRALILAPTRELAIQIGDEFRAYGKYLHLRHVVIFGGVSQVKQVRDLRRGADIVVATPGRLLDLMGQGHLSLDRVEMFVLDEADRMLDMGFIRDVRKIVSALPANERQSMLFSATMPPEVSKLAADLLYEPVRIDIAPKKVAVEAIRQGVHFVEPKAKFGLLMDMLVDETMSRVIVFTRTKHRANKVAQTLEKAGIAADAIHGNKSQGARQRALEGFRKGNVRVLVATDIAARGIDVSDVSHVVNFELPNVPESYVHRIGRTARAGAAGTAISFCSGEEREFLRDIEKFIRMQIPVVGGNSGSRQVSETPDKPRKPANGNRPKRNRTRRNRRPQRRAA